MIDTAHYNLKKKSGRYYVIQVSSGTESVTETYIRKYVSKESYSEMFHPMRLVRKKIRGVWKDVHQKLLPGYIFVKTSNPEIFFTELKKVPKMTKMLGADRDYFVALNDDEEKWLLWLLDKCHGSETNPYTDYEVGLSYVEFDENDRISIVSGPLLGFEGEIKRINKHKRLAEIETTFMGKVIRVSMGLELIKLR